MKNDEGWRMNDEGWWFQAVEGFLWLTDERTDICECRVAFATEKTHWNIRLPPHIAWLLLLSSSHLFRTSILRFEPFLHVSKAVTENPMVKTSWLHLLVGGYNFLHSIWINKTNTWTAAVWTRWILCTYGWFISYLTLRIIREVGHAEYLILKY